MSTKRKAEYLLFVDVSMDPKYISKVLEHFKLEIFGGIAQCNECDAILKAKVGVTTGLLKHLRTNHSIDVMKQKAKQKAKQKPAVEISKWCTELKKTY